METIAVYWEPKIKTYGLSQVQGLVLLEFNFLPAQIEAWGDRLGALDQRPGYHLVLAQDRSDLFRLLLVVDAGQQSEILEIIALWFKPMGQAPLREVVPVDLIHFQGPHFGDRYGVAGACFSALAEAGVPILACACAGSTVYVVLPAGRGQEAAAALSEVFEVPGKKEGR